MAKELKYHDFANVFPLLDGEEFDKLVDDIKENGLREKIVLHDGKILDGRNRYRACLKSESEPEFRDYTGDSSPWGLLRYVVSLNVHRRQMTSDQRAACAVKAKGLLEKLKAVAKEKQREAGGDRRSEAAKESLEEKIPQAIERAPQVRDQLAETFATNARYVSDLIAIEKESPELIDQVQAGQVRLSHVNQERREQAQGDDRRDQAKRIKVAAPAEVLKTVDRYRLIVVGTEWVQHFRNDWVGSMGSDDPLAKVIDDDCLLYFLTGGDAEIGHRAGNIIDHWGGRRANRYFAITGTEKFTGELWEPVIVGFIGKVPIENIVPRGPVKCDKAGVVATLSASADAWLKAHNASKLRLHFAGKDIAQGFVNRSLNGELVAA